MKYKIISSKRMIRQRALRKLRAKRKRVADLTVFPPLPKSCPRTERINFEYLFAIGELPQVKRQSRFRKAARALSAKARATAEKFSAAMLAAYLAVKNAVKKRLAKRRPRPKRLAFFLGSFCASFTAMLLSAAIVLTGLFSGYLAPYEQLTIPDLVGRYYDDVATNATGFELTASYEYSDTVPGGVIISQTPSAHAVRKIYKNGRIPIVAVTVSRGRHYTEIGELVGKDELDVKLALKNLGVAVKVLYSYSDTVKSGTVIKASHASGDRIYDGESVTLTVSKGKKINTVSAPDLYGLSESQAKELLSARGLALGKTVYTTADAPQGKIIGQSPSAYSTLNEGDKVDITVSLGNAISQKLIPDLYGMTVAEATKALKDVGLVVGAVIPVTSATPSGTVIAQTPAAKTPITSSITSVDIYVSS